MNKLGKNIGSK